MDSDSASTAIEPNQLKAYTIENIVKKWAFHLKESAISEENVILEAINEAKHIHQQGLYSREQLIGFLTWVNNWEELGYTEDGIIFYIDEYLKTI